MDNGTYKHRNTIGELVIAFYGNPCGTFFENKGLLVFLRKWKDLMNEAEAFLVKMKVKKWSSDNGNRG